MRPSGRAADELRTILLEPGFSKYAEGSCLARFGETHVACATPRSRRTCRPSCATPGTGWVTAEYGMLPRSTHTRTDREAARGTPERAYAGDSAPDRPVAARGDRHGCPGRAPDPGGLRRDPGGRRHPDGRDHGRLGGFAHRQSTGWSKKACFPNRRSPDRWRRCRAGSTRTCPCSIWTTPRTATPTPTPISC